MGGRNMGMPGSDQPRSGTPTMSPGEPRSTGGTSGSGSSRPLPLTRKGMGVRITPLPAAVETAGTVPPKCLNDYMVQCGSMAIRLSEIIAWNVKTFEPDDSPENPLGCILEVEVWVDKTPEPTWVYKQENAAGFLVAVGSPLFIDGMISIAQHEANMSEAASLIDMQ